MKPLLAILALLSALLLWDHPGPSHTQFRVFGRPSLDVPWQLVAEVGTNRVFQIQTTNGAMFYQVAAYFP